jgi:NAD(P)-dependent dehydrogenase (short-subunit alcohol dehydrogenase family)/acyl carrier protein
VEAAHHAPLADRLVKEVLAESNDVAVAYRGSHRWVQTFEQVPHRPTTEAALPLRPRGTYLITGGLGKIGLELARHLARTVQARLVLLARTEVPAREDWPQRLSSPTTDEATRERIRALQELEALGAEVLVLRADVADPARLSAALEAATTRFGPLHGVIHAAGTTGDRAVRLIDEATPTDCEWHFGPKVRGLQVLASLLEGRALDFCILCSSLASVLGGLGYAAYASANRFMDAFAQAHGRSGTFPWISLNWEGWRTDGDAAPGKALGASLRELTVTPVEGVKSFEHLLTLEPVANVLMSTGALQARIDRWTRFQETGGAPGPEAARTPLSHVRPTLRTEYVAPRGEVERLIAELWQPLLGIDRVGIHDNFFELGGHSLLATQLTTRLKVTFKVELPLRRLLATPTVAGLAEVVIQAQAEQVDDETLAQMLADLEALSDEDTATLLAASDVS